MSSEEVLYSMNQCGAEFAAFIRKEHGSWARVMHEANMKAK